MEPKEGVDEPLAVIRVGTRESALAMVQTEEVVSKLKQAHPTKLFKVGMTRSIFVPYLCAIAKLNLLC